MNLKVYLTTQDMTIKDFSELIGVTPRWLSCVIHGHAKPSKYLAKIIMELCEGKVDLNQPLGMRRSVTKPINVTIQLD
jgi:hypothetical protein